jgi:nucleoside-diphosphate-sugar epimerase
MKVMQGILNSANPETRLILASSGAVYGSLEAPTNGFEEGQFNPAVTKLDSIKLSSYGELKTRLEHSLFLGNELGLIRGAAARLFSFYGPNLPLNNNFAIGNFIDDIVNHREISVLSQGKSLRNYQHGLDLALDLISLLVSDFTGSINIGGPQNLSLLELIEKLNVISDSPYKILGNPGLERNYIPNLELFNQIFTERIQIDLTYGLKNWIEVESDTHKNRQGW